MRNRMQRGWDVKPRGQPHPHSASVPRDTVPLWATGTFRPCSRLHLWLLKVTDLPGEEGNTSWDPLIHTHTGLQTPFSTGEEAGWEWGAAQASDFCHEAASLSPGGASQTWAEGLALLQGLCSLPGRSTDWMTKGCDSKSPDLWGYASHVNKQTTHSKHLLASVITQGKCHVCHCAVRAARRLRRKQLRTSINIFNGVIPTLWCTCFRMISQEKVKERDPLLGNTASRSCGWRQTAPVCCEIWSDPCIWSCLYSLLFKTFSVSDLIATWKAGCWSSFHGNP